MSKANPVAIIAAAIPTAILVGMGAAHIVADRVAVKPQPPVRIVRYDGRTVESVREADRREGAGEARRGNDELLAEIRLEDAVREYKAVTGREWNGGMASTDCASVELANVREAIRRAKEARNPPRGASAR